jgi:hypothetical protein
LITPSQKKLKLWKLLKSEDSIEVRSASSFHPDVLVRRGGLWTKHMGLNQGAIGNTLGEPIGNLGNILET